MKNGFPKPSLEQYDGFVTKLHIGGVYTKMEAAMAVAQMLWESSGFQNKKEWGCNKATGCPNKYDEPLSGCNVLGQQYYGRGYLKIRGCAEYLAASRELYGNEMLAQDPEIVARNETVAWETSFWYWRQYVHSKPGLPVGLFGVTTRAINGDLECYGPLQEFARMRFEIYKVVRRAFGYYSEPDERGCYS